MSVGRMLVGLACALVLAVGPAGAEDEGALLRETLVNQTPVALGNRSVALVDDATALWLNPAAIGRYSKSCTYLAYTDWNKSKQWGLDLVHSTGDFALGYDRLEFDDGEALNTYALGLSLGGHGLWFGNSIRWLRSAADYVGNTYRWDAGFLIRPMRSLSVGIMGKDLTEEYWMGHRITRSYIAGVGYRPGTTRFSLTLDGKYIEGSNWENLTYGVGLHAEPLDGIVLTASAGFDEDNDLDTYSLGLSLFNPRGGIVPVAEFNDDNKLRRVSYAFQSFGDYGRSVRPRKSIAEVKVGGVLADDAANASPMPFSGGSSTKSAFPILRQLRKAKEDPSIKGILLKIESVGGRALVQEIRQELQAIKDEGKPVVAYCEEIFGPTTYLLAAKADAIVVPEASILANITHGAEILMMGAALDSLGIEWDRSAHGKYKSAYSFLERYELTEPDREQIHSFTYDIHVHFVEEVAADRGMSFDQFQELADGRVFSPEEAKEAGLIDELGNYDDAQKKLGELVAMGEKPPKTNLAKRRYRKYEWAPYPRIAVLWADGAIHTGKSTGGFFGPNSIGSDTVVGQLKELREDSSIKAVVFRIESGGGDGTASDLIWQEVRKYHDDGKPIVATMGKVAGSGGYYIACAANKIYADPATLTGSIGVVTNKPVLDRLYDKLHLNVEKFEHGKHATLFSSSRHWTEEEQEMLDEFILDFYDFFLKRVIDVRDLTYEEVDKVAQGRIWSGRQAVDVEIIDATGGLYDAIEEAKRLAGIDGKATIVHHRRPHPSFFEKFLGSLVEEAKVDAPGLSSKGMELVVPWPVEEIVP